MAAALPFVAPGRQAGRQIRLSIFPEAGPPVVINTVLPTGQGQDVPQIPIAFTVRRSLGPEPGRATIVIANLQKLTRDTIATYARRPGKVRPTGITTDGRVYIGTRVLLEAGYLGTGTTVIMNGQLAAANSEHIGTEWITRLEVGDSEVAWTNAECRQVFEAPAPAQLILQYCFATMGLGLMQPIPAAIAGYVLQSGFVGYGRSRDVVDSLLSGIAPDLSQLPALAQGIANVISLWDSFAGGAPLTRPITWWAEDGLAYLIERGRALPGAPLLVSSEGQAGAVRLLARPIRLEDGGVRLRMLMQGSVRIARPVTVVSRELAGAYRVEALEHMGGNRLEAFQTVADCRLLA